MATEALSNEHDNMPGSPTKVLNSPSRASFQSHGRSMSIATDSSGAAPRSNRLSLSFPVLPTGSVSPIRTDSPTVDTPKLPIEATQQTSRPSETNFFTAIAAQERRVLELKEELSRAEADLTKLKRQWAQHEAQRKRNDVRRSTQLEPLRTSLSMDEREEDLDGSNAWMQQEMERRKALLSSSKASNRTVFSGSRHTRTLSLLSPTIRTPNISTQERPARPPRKDSLSESARRTQEVARPPSNPVNLPRASTLPDLSVDDTGVREKNVKVLEQSFDNDILLETGKKMAAEFGNGLWGIWKDLKQATVGEEVMQVPPPSRKSSRQSLRTVQPRNSKTSLRPSSRSSSAGKPATDMKRPSSLNKPPRTSTMSPASGPALADPSFWTQHGIKLDQATPSKKTIPAEPVLSKSTADTTDYNEGWDTWEESSPQASSFSSAASDTTTQPSTISGITSPRISSETPARRSHATPKAKLDVSGKKDPIPWPTLANLGPKALRRTATNLMSEWERNLTPSPGKEYHGQADYLGLNADAAAVNDDDSRKKE